jgi:hypothetical protein
MEGIGIFLAGTLVSVVVQVVYRDLRKPRQQVWCCARYHVAAQAGAAAEDGDGTGTSAEPEETET